MRLYVYCLCDELSSDAIEALDGVNGAPVRLIRFGRLAAVASECEDESVAVKGENLRAHNAVNARVLASVTPVPFRFGTLASESRLAEYVAANEVALASSLLRVRGCVEMGVKIRRDARKADGEGALTNAGSGAGVDAPGLGSGTAFLLAKKREITGDESRKVRAEEVAAWLASRASALVRESSVQVNLSEAMVVRAAHLVESARLEEYRQQLRALGVERDELHFLTSGPWPPYSFGELRS